MRKTSTLCSVLSVCIWCLAAVSAGVGRASAQASQANNSPVAQASVVATVNDEPIYDRDLIASRPRVDEVRKLIASADKDQLEVWIQNRLLQQEVQKLGLSYNMLMQNEVVEKASDPTEEEAKQYYGANRKLFVSDYATYRDYIMQILQNTHQRQRLDAFVSELRAKARVRIRPAGQGGAGSAAVLASVNDDKVTAADLADTVKQYVLSLQMEIYNTQLADVQLKITDKLIEQEAKRRGIPAEQLVSEEVTSKARKITDDDVVRFFVENGSQITESFEKVKPRIEEYLREQALQEARTNFVETMKAKAKISVSLAEPEPPVVHLSDVADLSIGRPDAPVTIVEFTDYQCPTCANAHPVVDQVLQAYGNKVRLVLRDLPLYIHANAPKAAEAAHCASAQGKYREYAALLYRNQNELSVPFLKTYADQAGLDRSKFDQELDSGKYAPLVHRDMEEADQLNVHSTPTFFINKRMLATGSSFENFKRMIDRELQRQGQK